MELGMIGLGRMGTNMVRRLRRAGHQCVVYDLDAKAVGCARQRGGGRGKRRSKTLPKAEKAARRLDDGAGSSGRFDAEESYPTS